MTHLHDLLIEARPWLEHYGYVALFLALMAEGMGIPTPGQTLLIGAALLSGHGEMNPVGVLGTGVAALLLGDNLGYALGRRGGRRLVLRLGVNRRRLRKVDRFYLHWGPWAVMLDCFFDGTRQMGSLLAGSATMPWWRFFLFDATGTLLWVGVWGFGSLQLERHTAVLHRLWSHINPYAIAASLLAVLGLAIWLWRRQEESHD